MAESAEEFYARVAATTGEDGRVTVPTADEGELFPWEVADGRLVPKVLRPPLDVEPPRPGQGGEGCRHCDGAGDDVRLWESWNFHVARPAAPSGLPLVLSLTANDHYDFTEMKDEQAAELGQVSVWLSRIMSHLPGVGRVNVGRWSDGSEHMTLQFAARPERMPDLSGPLATEWDRILPPVPQDRWLEDCRTVATKLAYHAGRSLV